MYDVLNSDAFASFENRSYKVGVSKVVFKCINQSSDSKYIYNVVKLIVHFKIYSNRKLL